MDRGEGKTQPIELEFCRDSSQSIEPYDRLLSDAMEGEPLLFAREDEVEAAWRIVEPILEHPSPVRIYDPGSWGPHEAERLMHAFGGWQEPWSPGEA